MFGSDIDKSMSFTQVDQADSRWRKAGFALDQSHEVVTTDAVFRSDTHMKPGLAGSRSAAGPGDQLGRRCGWWRRRRE